MTDKPDTLCINPDGLEMVIPAKPLVVGASFFLPCVNTVKAKKQVRAQAKELGITLKAVALIEDNKYGVRIWRTL